MIPAPFRDLTRRDVGRFENGPPAAGPPKSWPGLRPGAGPFKFDSDGAMITVVTVTSIRLS